MFQYLLFLYQKATLPVQYSVCLNQLNLLLAFTHDIPASLIIS